ARTLKRAESQGGRNATSATSTVAAAAGTYARGAIRWRSPPDAPAPSSRKNGTPHAGTVQSQSTDACASQYAAPAKAAVAAGSAVRVRPTSTTSGIASATTSKANPI